MEAIELQAAMQIFAAEIVWTLVDKLELDEVGARSLMRLEELFYD